MSKIRQEWAKRPYEYKGESERVDDKEFIILSRIVVVKGFKGHLLQRDKNR